MTFAIDDDPAVIAGRVFFTTGATVLLAFTGHTAWSGLITVLNAIKWW